MNDAARDALGWGSTQQAAWDDQPELRAQTPARIVRQERAWFWVDTGQRELRAGLAGRFRHHASGATDLGVIGDWVLLPRLPSDPDEPALITEILPRSSVLVRRRAGRAPGPQPIAANVDLALIVYGLDREFVAPLVERGVVMASAGGVEPMIVLTKADVCADVPARIAQVCSQLAGIRVLALSSQSGDGIRELVAAIGARRTATMLGPSGVGKSSLVNRLLGFEAMRTGDVREEDQKGNHTTTHRQLFRLPEGGLLIDGPGMRELGVWGDAEAVAESFPDVMEAAARCVRRRCRHVSELDCAVLEAVRSGRLSADRVEDFRRLRDEIAHKGRPKWRRGAFRSRT